MHCAFILYSSYQELRKLQPHRNEEIEKVDNFSSVTWHTLNKVNRALDLLKIKIKQTYPGTMEENSNYPEAIILSGESKNLKCLKMLFNIFYLWRNCDQGQQWTNVGFFYLASGSARPGQAATFAGDHHNGQLFVN